MEQSEKNTGLFEELMEAVEDINQWREGKIRLNTYLAESQPKPKSYATTLRAKMTPESRAVSAEQTQAILHEMQAGNSVGKGQ
jgi:hypothetical protein